MAGALCFVGIVASLRAVSSLKFVGEFVDVAAAAPGLPASTWVMLSRRRHERHLGCERPTGQRPRRCRWHAAWSCCFRGTKIWPWPLAAGSSPAHLMLPRQFVSSSCNCSSSSVLCVWRCLWKKTVRFESVLLCVLCYVCSLRRRKLLVIVNASFGLGCWSKMLSACAICSNDCRL